MQRNAQLRSGKKSTLARRAQLSIALHSHVLKNALVFYRMVVCMR